MSRQYTQDPQDIVHHRGQLWSNDHGEHTWSILRYCDVLLESRNIGARVYDRFLDNGLAKRLHNSRRPSLYNGNAARTIGERYCDTTHWLEAFPLQRNSCTMCSGYGPRRDYTREKTFSSEVSAQRAINQSESVLRKQSAREVSS
jgi:hypothetical protein